MPDRHHVANPTSAHEFAVAEPLADSSIANGLFVFAVESDVNADEML